MGQHRGRRVLRARDPQRLPGREPRRRRGRPGRGPDRVATPAAPDRVVALLGTARRGGRPALPGRVGLRRVRPLAGAPFPGSGHGPAGEPARLDVRPRPAGLPPAAGAGRAAAVEQVARGAAAVRRGVRRDRDEPAAAAGLDARRAARHRLDQCGRAASGWSGRGRRRPGRVRGEPARPAAPIDRRDPSAAPLGRRRGRVPRDGAAPGPGHQPRRPADAGMGAARPARRLPRCARRHRRRRPPVPALRRRPDRRRLRRDGGAGRPVELRVRRGPRPRGGHAPRPGGRLVLAARLRRRRPGVPAAPRPGRPPRRPGGVRPTGPVLRGPRGVHPGACAGVDGTAAGQRRPDGRVVGRRPPGPRPAPPGRRHDPGRPMVGPRRGGRQRRRPGRRRRPDGRPGSGAPRRPARGGARGDGAGAGQRRRPSPPAARHLRLPPRGQLRPGRARGRAPDPGRDPDRGQRRACQVQDPPAGSQGPRAPAGGGDDRTRRDRAPPRGEVDPRGALRRPSRRPRCGHRLGRRLPAGGVVGDGTSPPADEHGLLAPAPRPWPGRDPAGGCVAGRLRASVRRRCALVVRHRRDPLRLLPGRLPEPARPARGAAEHKSGRGGPARPPRRRSGRRAALGWPASGSASSSWADAPSCSSPGRSSSGCQRWKAPSSSAPRARGARSTA